MSLKLTSPQYKIQILPNSQLSTCPWLHLMPSVLISLPKNNDFPDLTEQCLPPTPHKTTPTSHTSQNINYFPTPHKTTPTSLISQNNNYFPTPHKTSPTSPTSQNIYFPNPTKHLLPQTSQNTYFPKPHKIPTSPKPHKTPTSLNLTKHLLPKPHKTIPTSPNLTKHLLPQTSQNTYFPQT